MLAPIPLTLGVDQVEVVAAGDRPEHEEVVDQVGLDERQADDDQPRRRLGRADRARQRDGP